MRDEKDILEALRICSDYSNECVGCLYREIRNGCDALNQDALELIIKLQSENEALKAELTAAQQAINAMRTRMREQEVPLDV